MTDPYAGMVIDAHHAGQRGAGGYPATLAKALNRHFTADALAIISQWPGYRPTPLLALSAMAVDAGVGSVLYKHEAGRFGLGSFKALGGGYAVFRLLAQRIEEETGHVPQVADLLAGRYRDITQKVTVTCATDGNHGRSVAWGASLFGCNSVIFVHGTVTRQRAEEIARLGARIVRDPGNYDDAVRAANAAGEANGWLVVSDTSYEGYMTVPLDVMRGYGVLLHETLEQLGSTRPTHVFLQGGVGGFAAAIISGLWEHYGANCPRIIIVEPENAACLLLSARNGRPSVVSGLHDTIMAGLACGEPSLVAWPYVEGAVSDYLAIPDEAVRVAIRQLAQGSGQPPVIAGESGAAGLAGLLVAAADGTMRQALGLDGQSCVLLVGTEGATDVQMWESITGRKLEQPA
ncbi:diaminopropionate ammonia-lyase [Komagataeibacter sp. AV436]|uniref:Diaminopropionate ammonia-lyase n=1 Tax=Komagataeibacter melomenusus TaxID=2766578 RepID=A0ABX2AFK5_9PROT|nr:diaminopropionate ammonia-lyase [Komagataeibacter melomenusus]NPC67110.1 diaminopropionate ammonia-lyase [Komagataeibacter melomenusus]